MHSVFSHPFLPCARWRVVRPPIEVPVQTVLLPRNFAPYSLIFHGNDDTSFNELTLKKQPEVTELIYATFERVYVRLASITL